MRLHWLGLFFFFFNEALLKFNLVLLLVVLLLLVLLLLRLRLLLLLLTLPALIARHKAGHAKRRPNQARDDDVDDDDAEAVPGPDSWAFFLFALICPINQADCVLQVVSRINTFNPRSILATAPEVT